jgi:hypothetical protein
VTQIKVGQVWKANDKRLAYTRLCTVVQAPDGICWPFPTDPIFQTVTVRFAGEKKNRILKATSFNGKSNGYALVKDAE